MSPAATFQTQLASIMEVLANTAVAEICELVDSGYSVLQLEISRSRKENEVLRRKLRLMELRAARGTALRVAVTASGTALLHASGRARAQLHGGHEPRRNVTSTGEAVPSRASNQETARCREPDPAADSGQETTQGTLTAGETTAAAIKVEDDNESWSEPDKGFCRVAEGQTETEAPSLLVKQEAAADDDDGGGGGVSSLSWTSGDGGCSSTSGQKTLSTSQRSETSGYNCLMFEPQLQHGSHTTQDALGEDPGCSSALNPSASVSADSGSSSFPFTLSEVSLSTGERQQPAGFHNNQQIAAPPADELPVRKEVAGRPGRDGWRQQDGFSRTSGHSSEDSGGKSFVCNCCGKTLACLKNLKTHMRVHTGEKPFICALCSKRFSDSSNLKRHQSVHTGEKRYGCVHCGKRFAQSGSLKVHMTVHTDCKQFRCLYCGKTFISGSHLRRHVSVHAGEKRFAAALQ